MITDDINLLVCMRSYFMSKGLQYVGSPWRSLKGVGGAGDDGMFFLCTLLVSQTKQLYRCYLLGDLSLRNRTLVLQTIRNLQVIQTRKHTYLS